VRLPIDRVFTLRGFGTVVTGTLLSGRIAAGDRLEQLPAGEKVNVRGVQVYNEPVASAVPGQRTAVNLQGVEVEAVTRGDLLVTPGCLAPGYLIDARLDLLPEHGLEHLQRVRFHHGAAEILCRVVLLEPGDIPAGGAGWAQLRLEAPYACAPGDRFVLRRYSPMITIGGGVVLDNTPAKHRRGEAGARELLAALQRDSMADRLAALVAEAGDAAALEQDLCRRLFVPADELERLADELVEQERALIAQRRPLLLLGGHRAGELQAATLAALGAYHEQHPLAVAAPKSALAAALPRRLPAPALDALVAGLARRGAVRESAEGVALAEHRVALSPEQDQARAALLRLYDEAGWAPPAVGDALAGIGVELATAQHVFHMLLRQGELVRLRDDLVFHHRRLQSLIDELRSRYAAGASFSVADFKDWTGVSRKHAIPLLEHLDQQRVTRRAGDLRVRV
jgi:selenocysteine-specific elongation factor